jgi:DNA-binding response OmpR family regulator
MSPASPVSFLRLLLSAAQRTPESSMSGADHGLRPHRIAAERPTSGVTQMQRALVIEDETDIADLVGLHLRDLNLQATLCRDGRVGLERALSESWRLVVLDLALPGVDGIEICRRLRETATYTPILIMSARGSEQERIMGLDCGADDYLSKPFSVLELIARVRALLRRVAWTPGPERAQVIRSGDLEIDLERRQTWRAGVCVELTAREFDLLAHLANHPGKVFTRAQLLDQVWGLTHDAYEHTVSSHINRLRAKLEPDPGEPRYLLTSWGVGYRFAER